MMRKLLLTVLLYPLATMGGEWPAVMNTSEDAKITNTFNGYSMDIKGVDGDTLYILDCHDFNYEDNYNYSGDFECRLSSAKNNDTFSNLLTYHYNQTADWENRGLFYAKHFASSCSDDKDWGRTRKFKLRGMTLEISISNEEIKTDGKAVEFNSFTLSVSVKNSPLHTTEISENRNPPEWFHKPSICNY